MSDKSWHGGKGSGRRSALVDDKTVTTNWERIFGSAKPRRDRKHGSEKQR